MKFIPSESVLTYLGSALSNPYQEDRKFHILTGIAT